MPGFAELARSGRIVFGTARLHHLPMPAARVRLIRTALDLGFRAFDVAPPYGNGVAERTLGEALRGVGEPVRVHSKAGIPVRIYPAWTDGVFPLARGIDTLTGGHRSAYARRDFSARTLRTSLEDSLRRLRREALDEFLLHEPPAPFSGPQLEEIVATMRRLIDEGKTRGWGIAGPTAKYRGELALPEDALVQQPLAEWDPGEHSRRRGVIVYGVYAAFRVGGSGSDFVQHVRELAAAPGDLRVIVSTIDASRLASWFSAGTA